MTRVTEFRNRFSPGGRHPGLTAKYASLDSYEQILHTHLVAVVFALSGGQAHANVIEDFVAIEPGEWQEWFRSSTTIDLFVMYSRTWRNTYLSELREVVAKGGSIRVVLPSLSPDNRALGIMAGRMGEPIGELHEGVSETATELAKLGSRVSIKYTRLYYTHAMYLSESGGYVSLYSYLGNRDPTPAIRLTPGPMLTRFRDEFSEVSKNASDNQCL